jgi:hypothetical protein
VLWYQQYPSASHEQMVFANLTQDWRAVCFWSVSHLTLVPYWSGRAPSPNKKKKKGYDARKRKCWDGNPVRIFDSPELWAWDTWQHAHSNLHQRLERPAYPSLSTETKHHRKAFSEVRIVDGLGRIRVYILL